MDNELENTEKSSEPNFIMPNANKFVPVYWDHTQKSFNLALGITPKVERYMERALEDLFDPIDKPKNPRFKTKSEKVEAALNLARNEQERIFIALQLGARMNRGMNIGDIIGGIMRSRGSQDDE